MPQKPTNKRINQKAPKDPWRESKIKKEIETVAVTRTVKGNETAERGIVSESEIGTGIGIAKEIEIASGVIEIEEGTGRGTVAIEKGIGIGTEREMRLRCK